MVERMRAMGASKNGFELVEIPKPNPKQGEVRIKVIFSVVNPGEEKVFNGGIVGRFLHAVAFQKKVDRFSIETKREILFF
jgi:NADPH:quinone reductase-like Zn-dependent oxidoreductase